MTQAAAEKRFKLLDGTQAVTFAGEQLAFASSQVEENPQPRWTELAIYRTVTGKYVLEKIGRSDTFHTENHTDPRNKPGKSALRYETLFDALEDVDPDAGTDDLDKFFVPCDVCKPSYSSEDPVIVEQDMHSVDSFATADDLVDALHFRKNGAVRSLSNLSRNLLDQAVKKDSDIATVRERPTDIS